MNRDEYDNLTFNERIDRVRQIWKHLEDTWNVNSDQLGWHVYYALVEEKQNEIGYDKFNSTGTEQFTPEIISVDLVSHGLQLIGWVY